MDGSREKTGQAIADRLAQMGYIAFVADIYGKGELNLQIARKPQPKRRNTNRTENSFAGGVSRRFRRIEKQSQR